MTSYPRPPATLHALADPRLHGAACAGKAPLFDSDVEGETRAHKEYRLHVAARTCCTCPVLTACADAVTELPATHRQGIWSGTDISSHTPKSRKDTAA